MRPGLQGEINVSDGDHKIDVAEHEVPLIRHMIRYDPEVSWNAYRVPRARAWTLATSWMATTKGSAHERPRPGSGPVDPGLANSYR